MKLKRDHRRFDCTQSAHHLRVFCGLLFKHSNRELWVILDTLVIENPTSHSANEKEAASNTRDSDPGDSAQSGAQAESQAVNPDEPDGVDTTPSRAAPIN